MFSAGIPLTVQDDYRVYEALKDVSLYSKAKHKNTQKNYFHLSPNLLYPSPGILKISKKTKIPYSTSLVGIVCLILFVVIQIEIYIAYLL